MMHVRSMCAVALLAMASVGCGSVLDGSPRDERSLLGDDTMRLVLSRTTVTEGELLPLTVTLTNTESSELTFEGNTCPYNVFEVEDAAGTRLDPRIELILCAAYTQTVRLAPGQSKSWSLQWLASRYAPSQANRPAGTQQVRLRARYWVNGKRQVAGNWQTVSVNPAP